MEPDAKKPKGSVKRYQALAEASALGFMFPLAIGIGFAWGWWMDKYFDTRPWLTAIFTAFGVIAAFINLFRFASGQDGDRDGE